MTRPIVVTGLNGRLGTSLARQARGVAPIVPLTTAIGTRVDLADGRAVREAIERIEPQIVVHLAAVVGGACDADPARAEAVNVGGTVELAAAARDSGAARFVFLSTAAVYGTSRARPSSEADPVMPVGSYATTKICAEEALRGEAGTMARDILRVFNVYGPLMQDSLITRLLNPAPGNPVHLAGLDGFIRDYIHVDDVARAILAAASSESSGHRIFNIGSGVPRSNRELYNSLTPAQRAAVIVDPPVASYSCADTAKATSKLGWAPIEPWPFTSPD